MYEKREKLWAELDAVLEEMAPFKAKEKAIRSEIAKINDVLYVEEMEESIVITKGKLRRAKPEDKQAIQDSIDKKFEAIAMHKAKKKT